MTCWVSRSAQTHHLQVEDHDLLSRRSWTLRTEKDHLLQVDGDTGDVPPGTGQPLTLNESLWTSTRISKAEPAVKGL